MRNIVRLFGIAAVVATPGDQRIPVLPATVSCATRLPVPSGLRTHDAPLVTAAR